MQEEVITIRGFVSKYIRTLFCKGCGTFRWTEDSEDLKKTDDLAIKVCKRDLLVKRWIKLARKNLSIKALLERICYMRFR